MIIRTDGWLYGKVVFALICNTGMASFINLALKQCGNSATQNFMTFLLKQRLPANFFCDSVTVAGRKF
ncbi:hypothetical protein NYP20_23865 [Pseudomonas sp. N3-W]|nr:hypothetical protein [Pseudomonas sp. N3-W]UWF48317.1 hypothetical protein NYP20_23865 [Pseudomonas sp. N3-W]